MKRSIYAFFIIYLIGCSTPVNQEVENYNGEQILVGPVNWEGLTQATYGEWFIPTYKDYQVDETSLNLLKPIINEIEIVVFLGTWCEDSQVQIPQFYKMMDYLGYDINAMRVIALERLETRELVSPEKEETEYNITHVPTFIFTREGQELGRIVEYPARTIEKDMVEIMLGQ